jgi:bifunctional enzyme CysN/CysC
MTDPGERVAALAQGPESSRVHEAPPRQGSPKTALRVWVADALGDAGTALAARLNASGGSIIAEAVGEDTRPNRDPAACDLCIVVTDTRHGLDTRARREAAIACTIGVRHLVLAVIKLDSAPWDASAFAAAAASFRAYAANFDLASARAIPLSTLDGDNVAARSVAMPWYQGPSLVEYLEGVERDSGGAERPLRLPIRAVSRPDPDSRHYLGTIASGTLRCGDWVQVAVSGVGSTVAGLLVGGSAREEARAGEDVAVALSSHIDLASGDVLVHPEHRPQITEQFAAHLAWLGEEPLLPGRDYTLKLGTRTVTASVMLVKYRLDVDTLHHDAARTLQRNELGACTIATAAPMAVDDFADFPQSGRFVLCDRHSGAVLAAGTIDFALRRGINIHLQPLAVSKSVRASLKAQGPCIVWFTGLSGAGKSTIANLVEGELAALGFHTYLLDGDNVRHGLNKDLGFTAADRVENVRRVGEVAKLFVDAGLIVLCSFISPFRAERAAVRNLVEGAEFIEVYVKAPLEVCELRDPKGLYAKSRAGRLPNFTGIDSPYEPPDNPDLVLDTASTAADDLARRVMALLEARGIVAPASGGQH